MKVNPLKYKNVVRDKGRYNLGAIWAVMLWKCIGTLSKHYGIFLRICMTQHRKRECHIPTALVGTLMIQPCNPTFDSAHDAMLAADDAYYGGINKHLIREGFAKRGLGSIS
ncbi:hypothetical protein BASA83_011168 [Batrachochytrium salamandrivorans]|nr:hypothetical protein BASA83_011168 [Batrachochytrium salamandrivorans]